MVATRRKKGDLDTSTEDAAEEEMPLGSFGSVPKDPLRSLKLIGLAKETLEAGAEFGEKVRELLVATFSLKVDQVDAVRRASFGGADAAFVAFNGRLARNRVFNQKEKLPDPISVLPANAEDVESVLANALPATGEEKESPPAEEAEKPMDTSTASAKEEVSETTNGDGAVKEELTNGGEEEEKEKEEEEEEKEDEEEKEGDETKEEGTEGKKDRPKGPFDYAYPSLPEFKSEPLMQDQGLFWRIVTAEEEAEKDLQGRQMILLGAGIGDVGSNVFLYHAFLKARSIDYHFDSKPPFLHPLNASSRLTLTFGKSADAMQALIDGLWSINKKVNSPGRIKVFVPKTDETLAQEAALKKKTGSTHKPDNYVPNRQVLIRNVDRNLREDELRSTLELADKVESVRVVQDAKNRHCVLVTFVSGKFALRTAMNQGRIRLGTHDRRTKERRWCDALIMKDMTTPDFLTRAEKILDKAREANRAKKRPLDANAKVAAAAASTTEETPKSSEEGSTPAQAKKEDGEKKEEAKETPKKDSPPAKMKAEEGSEPSPKKAKEEPKAKAKTGAAAKRGGPSRTLASIRKPPIGTMASRMMGGSRGSMAQRGGAPMGPVWASGPRPLGPRMGMGSGGMGGGGGMGSGMGGGSGGGGMGPMMTGRTEQLQSLVMEQQRQLDQMSQVMASKLGGGGGVGGGGVMGGGFAGGAGRSNFGSGGVGGGGGNPQQRSVFDQGGRGGAGLGGGGMMGGGGGAMGGMGGGIGSVGGMGGGGRPDVWASQPRAYQQPQQQQQQQQMGQQRGFGGGGGVFGGASRRF